MGVSDSFHLAPPLQEVIFSNVVFRFVDMCRLEELISLGSGSSISLDPSCGVAYDVVPYEGRALVSLFPFVLLLVLSSPSRISVSQLA